MIKVLHMISSLSVGSGLMSVIMNYYRFIDRSKVQFGFVYFKDIKVNTYEDEIKSLGGECFLIKEPSLSYSYKRYVENFFNDHKDYHIFHLHELYLGLIFSPCAKKKAGMIIIGHAHTTKFAESRLSSIRNKILCIPNRWQLNYMMACSVDAGKTYFGKRIEDKNRFSVLKNAIEVDKYSFNMEKRKSYRKALSINDGEFVVGHIGRFSPPKNHIFISKIIEMCASNTKNYRFVLIGDGPLKTEIENVINAHGLSKTVLFLGNRNDVGSLYSAMDAFILPSTFEGLGIVAIEAQVNGLPCFVSQYVPDDALILNTTKKLSIDDPKEWMQALEQTDMKREKNAIEEVSLHGYDIRQAAVDLEEYYLKIYSVSYQKRY